ncbi:MAG TPA: SAM-dependent chlorinase/fluorinase [Bacteroidales bacterium]|nr:SAM-dependent chlorinase/fluorinase [Bacteroidales bacterium]
MPIITLTTDWNQHDYYVGAIKGSILSLCPDATIIDISHAVQPFNIVQAAFVLRNAFPSFPPDTIHLIGVQSTLGRDGNHLLVKAQNQFFIGSDNGVFGALLNDEPESIYRLRDNSETNSWHTFPEISSFVTAACDLMRGKMPEEIGEKHENYKKHTPWRPTIDESVINGGVVYIDSYRNAITNISEDLFSRIRKGRAFEILVQSNHYRITRINKTYQETTPGELLALFNSAGLLEVAINLGNAADLLNLDTNSRIRIKFKDK